MRTFRNRLLILIIGLVVGAQTVTLVASLARTGSLVRERASEQLAAGALVARELIGFRAQQLANAVTVLAADFGLREAVASADAPTIASAITNHGSRIGAQFMMVLDPDGRPISSSERGARLAPGVGAALLRESGGGATEPHFLAVGERVYQVFVAPVQAPDLIGWVAMGFAIDDRFAAQIRGLVDVDVTLLSAAEGRARVVGSTLRGGAREALADDAAALIAARTPREFGDGDEASLVGSVRLSNGDLPLHVALHEPMREVNAPYYELGRTLLAIALLTLLVAIAISWVLGRSAVRPIDRLVLGARRIEHGDYSASVEASGGEELERLASTFNAMQSGIAEREARILRFATHDTVTGLPNRRAAEQWLERTLAAGADEARAALIVVHFVNHSGLSATLGFEVADDAIRELGRRLQGLADGQAIVARVDGPHLLLAQAGLRRARAEALASECIGRLGATLRLADVAVQPAVLCGVSLAPEHGTDPAELLRRAESALEAAAVATQKVAVFDPASDDAQRRRLQLGAELPEAIESGQLSLVYQPKVSFSSRRVRSAEVLTRWTHDTFGPIPPLEFVTVAEQTGASRLLSRWVLRTALQQLASWSAEGIDLDLAVNLSATDVVDPTLPDFVISELRAHGVPGSRLLLEITESAFMRDAEVAARHMELLRVAGVRFSIDDFGTGYSSLSQLRRLPVDEIKIDRSFLVDAASDDDRATIVHSIIELGHTMDLEVVAEGVETEAQWRWLASLGCDLAQGYLISRPVGAREFARFIVDTNAALGEDPSDTRLVQVLEQRTLRG
jgi:diguanylate cyclase (GGDEF)-like protein